VLEQCLSGEVPEANALPQLLHQYRSSAKEVLGALSEKASAAVANADAGIAAARAGTLIIRAASFLDGHAAEEPASSARAAKQSSALVPAADAQGGAKVSKALLDHVLILTGGESRAAKEKAVRAQGCALVSALAAAVPEHKGAEEKLKEFALDKVPSIREKAVRGLSAMRNSAEAQQALSMRTSDPCTAVRASAVRGLSVSSLTVTTLLERIDDVEACVRAQLFHRLADQPSAVEEMGSAALVRLVAGLSDRSASVRSAAGRALDCWHERLGGALAVLARCDIMGDEVLGEVAASALAARFPREGRDAARAWLGRGEESPLGHNAKEGALLARLAVTAMAEEERDAVIDMPSLLQRTRGALEGSLRRKEFSCRWQAYLLRQLLHVVALADVTCDESVRRSVEQLAEDVLTRAPQTVATDSTDSEPGDSVGRRRALTAVDLGIVILRKCCGLSQCGQARMAKHQALEAHCSTRVVLLVSDLCQPLHEGCDADEAPGNGLFTTRLSRMLEELNAEVEKREREQATLTERKKKAVAAEEYVEAERLKNAIRENDKQLAMRREQQKKLKEKRDSLCLRVLAIVTALLRWSNSEVRKDPALFGILERILRPIISLPALSEELEVAAVSAICLFCVRDGDIARNHLNLLLTLLRGLQQSETAKEGGASAKKHSRAKAAVAAHTLADCARLYGGASLDRDEILSTALALAAVPFSARQVVVEPLCGWLLNLGHIFFEEHLREPVLEVQWALGWLLVEAFKQRRQASDFDGDGSEAAMAAFLAAQGQRRTANGAPKAAAKARSRGMSWVTRPKAEAEEEDAGGEEEDDESDEAMAMSAHLTQFFNLLPKLPGKHGAPMLSLAVESVAESGLWRRAALMPRFIGGQTRWLRGFSWPSLFAFAHERLPVEMRFRIWKCALQLCVASPTLAPLAEVPFALVSVANEAPAGAAELLREAISLGADKEALAPLVARLPPARGAQAPKGLLVPRKDFEGAERERREELASLGVRVDDWAPADVEAPEVVPPHLRMRMGRGRGRGRGAKAENTIEVPSMAASYQEEASSQRKTKRRRQIDWDEKLDGDQVRLPLRENNSVDID